MPPALICLVVSLPDAQGRRAGVANALRSQEIAFEFVDAINAASGFDATVDPRVRHRGDASMSNGEYACALSHRLAIERFLAQDVATHVLVLEDDALPTAALARFIAGEHYRARPMLLLFHSRARVHRGRHLSLFDDVVARPLALNCTGAVAYTLDRDAATKMLAAHTPVHALADFPMDITTLDAHVLEPMIVGHPERIGDQSSLEVERAGNRQRRDAARILTLAYVRRRWRKAISKRIS